MATTIIVTSHFGLMSRRQRAELVHLLDQSAGRANLLDTENLSVLVHRVSHEDRLVTQGLGADVVINVISTLPPRSAKHMDTIIEGLKNLVTRALGGPVTVKVELSTLLSSTNS